MSKNTVPDVIKHDLDILFVGINPGLMSAKIGHHFGHPGNRFWPSLYSAGFTPSLLSPYMESKLLQYGYGITNLVPRATKTAAEISTTELIDGLKLLDRKINIYRPKWIAILGIQAYRLAFADPKAKLGLQSAKRREAKVWVLPNPSGLNAHFTLPKLSSEFGELFRHYNKNQS